MFRIITFILISLIIWGCKDTPQTKTNNESNSNPVYTNTDIPKSLQILESINPDYDKTYQYTIYQIPFENENIFLYIQKNEKGILKAAFKRDNQTFKCALKNTLKNLESGVLNGIIDCQKQFIATITDGEITQATLTKQNLATIINDQKAASDISAVSATQKIELSVLRSFDTLKQTAIKTSSNSTRAARFDFLCSDSREIQHILNANQTRFFHSYKVALPENCKNSKKLFDEFMQKAFRDNTIDIGDNYGIEYNDYMIDFFNEDVLQIKRTRYIDMGGAHGIRATSYKAFSYEGKEIYIAKDFFAKQEILTALAKKHKAFLDSNPQCQMQPPAEDFDYTQAEVALGYDGINFIYEPYKLAPYSCGEVKLHFDFTEIGDLLPKNSSSYKLLENLILAKPKEPHNSTQDTLYIECAKCVIPTLYTQEQILELRNTLDDEEFYKLMSYKELDRAYLKQVDIDIKPEIYNGDYKFIDFNHKYILHLENIQGANYILYQEGKKPYCVQNKDNNAEIDKYFNIKDFIEIKVRNTLEKIKLDSYLKDNNIDMNQNTCTLESTEIQE